MIEFFTKLFFENKLMRIAAVAMVFYFGVYKYDESDNSVAKRYNKDVLSKDFKDVKNQTKKIFDVVSRSRSHYDNINNTKDVDRGGVSKFADFTMKDHILLIDSLDTKFIRKSSNDNKKVDCLDVVGFSYRITDKFKNEEVYKKSNNYLTISEQENIFFERLLYDMSYNEEKEIVINQDYNFLPSIVRKYLLTSEKNIIIINLKLDKLQKGDAKKINSLNDVEKLICKKK